MTDNNTVLFYVKNKKNNFTPTFLNLCWGRMKGEVTGR
jgi:hypothetical protein